MADRTARKENGLWETVKTIFWALIIAGIFRTLFFQPFWIPSGSMKDTLLIGDFLFVNKMAYGYAAVSCPFSMCPVTGRILGSEPERGDVVVFRHPTKDVDFIKRLIGLPGDRVQMKDGILSINGTPAPQKENGFFLDQIRPDGAQIPIRRATETLPNGVSHDVLNGMTGGCGDTTAEFTVPEGHYFFMGDNRDDSSDSRWPTENDANWPYPAGYPRECMQQGVGMVAADKLIGRAEFVLFSSAGKSLLYFWTWRADRFLKAVN